MTHILSVRRERLFILVIEREVEETEINLKATLADEIGSYFQVMYRRVGLMPGPGPLPWWCFHCGAGTRSRCWMPASSHTAVGLSPSKVQSHNVVKEAY